ncbi:MAG: flagellar hook-associated protein FlgK [Planctomycetota bacterium]
MSLFASLNLARLSLMAHQTAIQTVGHNIANASTEGYARQRVQMRPTPADDLVFARIGTGVMVERIERIVNEHLEATLRDSRSGLGDFTEQNRIYQMLESVFNDLGGGGLSETLNNFFNALEDLANQPEDATARFIFLEESTSLADTLNFLDDKVRQLRSDLDDDIVAVYEEINRITTELADLNKNIVLAEKGGEQPSTANDLRTQRDFLLGKLSELIDIKVIENNRGAVQVLNGNDVLVFDSHARTLDIRSTTDGDITLHEGRFSDNGDQIRPRGGRLAALVEGRDSIVKSRRDQLDTLAKGLLDELNALHTGGEGLTRHTSVRSANAVDGGDLALASAGLPFAVEDGSFLMQVVNEGDGTRESYTIFIDADGLNSDDTTLKDLATLINTVVGSDHPEISAQVTVDGFLEITSSDPSLTFTFRDDNSGFLVASGINTLFSGSNARSIQVSSWLLDDPSKVAAGRGGGVADNSVVLDMLALRDQGFLGASDMTFDQYYNALVGKIGVEGAKASDLLRNQEAITQSFQNQREALSGVNIDEEAINLIRFQRAYQASARFLNVVDRLLETLINSV